MNDFNNYRHPVAQKEHRCVWCGETIRIQETHVHYTGRWQNEFQDWRMHNECYEDATINDVLSEGFGLYDHERPKA